ncbi:RNA polymerase sigma factor [Niallia sp. 01092]|uniref:RNA polymerase sigma factor n=1 Tax=unclassified Niallia TaxID=2837522 RepID=UPI003FD4C56E
MDDINKNNQLNSELNIVYRYLCKIGISQTDAEDAVQDAAVKYLQHYDSIKTSKVRSWLFRVALNSHYDQYRKQQRYDLNENMETVKIDFNKLPETIFLDKERNMGLKQAIFKLKPKYQELLLLKYYSGLSYDSISALLNMSIGSVKTNLYRARKQLAKVYKEESHG